MGMGRLASPLDLHAEVLVAGVTVAMLIVQLVRWPLLPLRVHRRHGFHSISAVGECVLEHVHLRGARCRGRLPPQESDHGAMLPPP